MWDISTVGIPHRKPAGEELTSQILFYSDCSKSQNNVTASDTYGKLLTPVICRYFWTCTHHTKQDTAIFRFYMKHNFYKCQTSCLWVEGNKPSEYKYCQIIWIYFSYSQNQRALKTNWQHFSAWKPAPTAQFATHSTPSEDFFLPKSINHLPIYTGNIYHYINHVTAQLIRLHVHRGAVCCNVDFADYIEEKSFFNAWILQKEKEFGWFFLK